MYEACSLNYTLTYDQRPCNERTKPNIIPSVYSTAKFATCISNWKAI